jgi:hypothetical protein
MKRDDIWLQLILDKIWDNYFNDVPQVNDVRIVFGMRAKRRLGSISLDPGSSQISLIVINGIFKRMDIPEFVVEATIFHELTHYAHGFNSPLARAQKHPHAGGVMRKEFAERGLLELYLLQKKWLKQNWPMILNDEFTQKPKALVRAPVKIKLPKPFWFTGE